MKQEIPVVGTGQLYRICWSAVFAGALVGLGLGFLLHLYGIAISLSAFSSSDQGAAVIAIGGLLGMLIGVIAAMVAAGFVAGYLGRFHYHHLHGGIIYGFVTWSLILLLSALMMNPMKHFVTAYGNTVAHTNLVEVSKSDSTNGTSSVAQNNKKTSGAAINASPTEIAWGGWIVFLLFFIGAVSCCVGATCGMHCRREAVEHRFD